MTGENISKVTAQSDISSMRLQLTIFCARSDVSSLSKLGGRWYGLDELDEVNIRSFSECFMVKCVALLLIKSAVQILSVFISKLVFDTAADLDITSFGSALKLGMSMTFCKGFCLANKIEDGGTTSTATATSISDFLMPNLLFLELESLS